MGAFLGLSWHAAKPVVVPPQPTPYATPSITLFLVGDVLPGRGVTRRLQSGRTTLHAFAPQIRAADLAFCNLEGAPLAATTDKKPSFVPANLKYLPLAGFDVVSLANNHALDAGAQGLATALKALRELHVGAAGARLGAGAFPTWQTTVRGQRVAVLAATAWPPFKSGAARVQEAHIAPLCEQVRTLTRGGAWVIVSLHWGVEGQNTTSPLQRAWAHQLIDAGALMVVGHHPHTVGEVENYQGHPIFYSLGNFLWDRMPTPQSGLAAQVTIAAGHPLRLSYRTTRVVPDAEFLPDMKFGPPQSAAPVMKATKQAAHTTVQTIDQPPTPRGEQVMQRVSGHFLSGDAVQQQWAVWTRRANGRHCLRLWERNASTWHPVAVGSPFDLRRIAVGDIDGDGRDELVTQLFQPSKLEGASRPRLHFYNADARRGWVPKWRGSHLSRPFLDWGLLPRATGRGCDLLAREQNTQPDLGEVEWLTLYRWNGFGLRALWQITVNGRVVDLRCSRDHMGPFVSFQRVQTRAKREFRLRPAQSESGEFVLREVAT